MKDYYVILTGSKNNAGDFLIKYRAKKLFAALRPDREIVDLDAWKPFDAATLELVNNAKALILMGGPALQAHMYPGIYALTPNLDDIKVPVTTMGIGWKSISGNWQDSYDYPLSVSALKLLEKAAGSGLPLSVRDFHTHNALAFKGFDNVLMTGCPAYYDLDFIGKEFKLPEKLHKVAFSLGVSFIESASMEREMKSQILRLKEYFKDSEFEVVFHHGLNPDVFLQSHGAKKEHNQKHNQFAQWLASEKIAYTDISGSAENLVEYYSGVDLHIGYRVHAHIFMNSISKMSVLIAEDGRGKATEKVIGGMVIEGFQCYQMNLLSKVLKKVLPKFDRYVASEYVASDLEAQLGYALLSNGHQARQSRSLIDCNFEVMVRYLKALP
ncbi:Polysaccharide pyruvyl transferase [Aquipseudomonas alcaligenes]|uniref:polysaccharide pyruvyl transferase family protein n=1 Tax=Aquipseudomonas alcaligenes TaxID=43263 RepID=UPI0009565F67|nr:polysaccharide pyruvyl transferase family protein [Pseudomonas alcaligenes]SIR77935.1 Polysaccharide pyruvyl transferase [Pseudomonas alcaligenes]